MRKGRLLGLGVAVIAALAVMAATAHAAAGAEHGPADCVACHLCAWLEGLLS